jgi:ribosomal protein S18 acetylase RimI-like enzyme
LSAVTASSWISEPTLEVLDLRHFTSADLRPVLEEESRVWTQRLLWDYRSSAQMILRYIDGKILPGYVSLKHGRVSGYCFFVYEGSKAVVGDLFVSSSGAIAGMNVEHRLLTHALATLQQSPGVHRIEAQLLQHESGALMQPFAACGFHRHQRLFMVMPLQDGTAESMPVPVPADVELRHWSEQDYQAAASVITAAYQGHVDAQINDQYHTASGSMRFLNNIVRFPGCGQFDQSSSFVAIDRLSHTMVGMVLCSRVKNDVGHVTQVCVVPEKRGHHIGEALLAATSRDLQRRNFAALSLTVTDANRNAVALYRQLGYRPQSVFDAFVWEG